MLMKLPKSKEEIKALMSGPVQWGREGDYSELIVKVSGTVTELHAKGDTTSFSLAPTPEGTKEFFYHGAITLRNGNYATVSILAAERVDIRAIFPQRGSPLNEPDREPVTYKKRGLKEEEEAGRVDVFDRQGCPLSGTYGCIPTGKTHIRD